jgi:Ca2+-binding RTX toxin-like protein
LGRNTIDAGLGDDTIGVGTEIVNVNAGAGFDSLSINAVGVTSTMRRRSTYYSIVLTLHL